MSKIFRWNLERPLAVFDIEATGTSPRSDRIVELAVVRIQPDQSRDRYACRVNPGVPIPPEATKLHGISDADVADCPKFAEIAPQLASVFEGCDLGGYNVLRFDIPMLMEEFARAGVGFGLEGRCVIDAQRIFHRREPRDLKAALAYYCGEMYLEAHGAEADALATVRVLERQFDKYTDLPRDMTALDEYCNPRDPAWVDRTGRLRWMNDGIVLNFGKKKGVPLQRIIEEDPGFIKWILKSDFPADTRAIVQDASEGKWPKRPAPVPQEQSANEQPD